VSRLSKHTHLRAESNFWFPCYRNPVAGERHTKATSAPGEFVRSVERALRLDAVAVLHALRGHGEQWRRWSHMLEPVLFPPTPVPVTCDGVPVGEAMVSAAVDWRRGHACIACPTTGRETLAEMIGSPCRVSGIRWWWRCGRTQRRVGALYRPPDADRFASRHEHGLLYATQRGTRADKAARLAQRLRRELGEVPPTLGGPLPDPPPRVSARRYLRICAAIREAEVAAGVRTWRAAPAAYTEAGTTTAPSSIGPMEPKEGLGLGMRLTET